MRRPRMSAAVTEAAVQNFARYAQASICAARPHAMRARAVCALSQQLLLLDQHRSRLDVH